MMGKNLKVITAIMLASAVLVMMAGLANGTARAQDPTATAMMDATMEVSASPEMGDATMSATMGGSVDATMDPMDGDRTNVTLESLTADPGSYYGQEVTLEGVVTTLVNVRAFVLGEGATIDDDQVLVLNNTGQDFPISLTADKQVVVSGVVRSFDDASLRTSSDMGGQGGTPAMSMTGTPDMLSTPIAMDSSASTSTPGMDMNSTPMGPFTDISLDDPAFDNYRDYTIIELTSVQSIQYIETIQAITDNPDNFAGQTFAIEGEIEEFVSANAFILGEGAAIDSDKLLVLLADGQQMDQMWQVGDQVRVYGLVRPFDQASIQTDYGVDLNDNVFSAYEGYTIVIAQSVMPTEQMANG